MIDTSGLVNRILDKRNELSKERSMLVGISGIDFLLTTVHSIRKLTLCDELIFAGRSVAVITIT